MLVQFATLPGRSDRPNEDFAGAFPGCAVLLDGAGGPSEMPSGCGHGTAWYVRQLGVRLLARMETSASVPLPVILAESITDVAGLHVDNCDLTAPGTPATTVVMARIRDGELDYLVLGDSTIVIDKGGPELRVISDRRIDVVAAAERAVMETLPTGTPQHQAARIKFVTLQRSLRNQFGGYWIASTSPDAAYEGYTGTVNAHDLNRVTLLSDGATRFVEFELGTWRELLGTLDTYGPASIFARIREAEATDPAGIRWPRAKRRDDAAVVHFTSHGRDGWGHLDVESWRRQDNGWGVPVKETVGAAGLASDTPQSREGRATYCQPAMIDGHAPGGSPART